MLSRLQYLPSNKTKGQNVIIALHSVALAFKYTCSEVYLHHTRRYGKEG